MSYCLVVPHYNHARSLVRFLPRLMGLNMPCIIVDDGSAADQLVQLQQALTDYSGVEFLQHQTNQGKGAAMLTGAQQARAQGFTHIIQIDADGQHDVADVAKFIATSEAHPTAIISGAPVFDDSAPKSRVYGRKVTDFWVALETWTLEIKDSLCGFRVYPLDSFLRVFQRYRIGRRMDIDTDLMVKSVWMGVPVRFIDTQVVYVAGNASHFHYLRDNVRLIYLHSRLMLGMLVRAPYWLVRGAFRRLKQLFTRRTTRQAESKTQPRDAGVD